MATTTIPRQSVDSSAMASIGYDPDLKEIHVEFPTGHVHAYGPASPELFASLQAADSKGRFFAQEIRSKCVGRKLTGTCHACHSIGTLGTTCDDCGTATIEH